MSARSCLSSETEIGTGIDCRITSSGRGLPPSHRMQTPAPRSSASWKTASGSIIIDMLEKCGWNQTEAAERFHVPLSTLNQKIKRLAIEIKKKNGHRDVAQSATVETARSSGPCRRAASSYLDSEHLNLDR